MIRIFSHGLHYFHGFHGFLHVVNPDDVGSFQQAYRIDHCGAVQGFLRRVAQQTVYHRLARHSYEQR